MRAATSRKKAMRVLWHAGKYLENQRQIDYGCTCTGLIGPSRHCEAHGDPALRRAISEGWALNIIANAYNQVLGESYVSRQKSLQR